MLTDKHSSVTLVMTVDISDSNSYLGELFWARQGSCFCCSGWSTRWRRPWCSQPPSAPGPPAKRPATRFEINWQKSYFARTIDLNRSPLGGWENRKLRGVLNGFIMIEKIETARPRTQCQFKMVTKSQENREKGRLGIELLCHEITCNSYLLAFMETKSLQFKTWYI